MSAYSKLAASAHGRVTKSINATRVAIQVGHCSKSAKAQDLVQYLEASSVLKEVGIVTTGCDGACFAAPQVIVTYPGGTRAYFQNVSESDIPNIIQTICDCETRQPSNDLEEFYESQYLLLMAGVGLVEPCDLDEYILSGGYASLDKALRMKPEEVIQEISASKLLGRGGAYFPPSIKWSTALNTDSDNRFLVVNAEEGEPGLFKDRHLMEGIPHRIIEGALISAYASGVTQCYVYINAEAELSAERITCALGQAAEVGLIGDNILDLGFSCAIGVMRGAGGYVCGEETTLLNTIEGLRREPRLKPPFPVESGLFQKPTVINNVETIANIPIIIGMGASRFSQIGSDTATGTKLFSLSGLVRRPGLVELPLGSTLRQIVYDAGGGDLQGKPIHFMAVGGPSSGLLPMSYIDVAMLPGFLHESGVVMGGGGVMVMDTSVPVMDAVKSFAQYNSSESCGKCTPCREGTPRLVELLNNLELSTKSSEDINKLRDLCEVLNGASLCGLGQMAGNVVLSALHFFRDDLIK